MSDGNQTMKEIWQNAVSHTKEGRTIELSDYYSYGMDHDIKHLGFIFARYKFAAKLIVGKENANILELGCNSGLGSQFFKQNDDVHQYLGVDFDDSAIAYALDTFGSDKISFMNDDFLEKNYKGQFMNGAGADAIVSIDVIEHIRHEDEDKFLKTIDLNLRQDGIAIIGTPNIRMNEFASNTSKEGHVNMFDQARLRSLLLTEFENVFIFNMNDEVVGNWFDPMSCYIMALCAGKRRRY